MKTEIGLLVLAYNLKRWIAIERHGVFDRAFDERRQSPSAHRVDRALPLKGSMALACSKTSVSAKAAAHIQSLAKTQTSVRSCIGRDRGAAERLHGLAELARHHEGYA